MYTITADSGPEFDEGDEVLFLAGAFEGQVGEVAGYDDSNEVYFVSLGGSPFLLSVVPSMLELVDDDQDWEYEYEEVGEHLFQQGERAVVTYGRFIGSAGVVLRENRGLTQPDKPVFDVVLDGGVAITISASSLELSIYQGEILEAVPSA